MDNELNAALDQAANEIAAMDPETVLFGIGFLAVLSMIFVIGNIVWFFVSAIGYYKMFKKAGESGWKAFIPYYSDYIRFKFAWNKKPFWLFLVAHLVFHFFTGTENFVLSLICLAAAVVYIVFSIKLNIRVAKSFGKTTAWGVMLFFFTFIVSSIIGFGKSEYIGNTTVDSTSAEK